MTTLLIALGAWCALATGLTVFLAVCLRTRSRQRPAGRVQVRLSGDTADFRAAVRRAEQDTNRGGQR